MAGEENFDPYTNWLGLPPGNRYDHYALLGIERFESDPAVIEQRADERMRLVRSFQTGPRGRYTHRLLNELTAAKLCLLSPSARQSYDDLLRGMPPDVPAEADFDDASAELPPTAELSPAVAAKALLATPLPPPVQPQADGEAAPTTARSPAFLWVGLGAAVLAVGLTGWLVASFTLGRTADAEAAGPKPVASLPVDPQPAAEVIAETPLDDDPPLIELQQEGSGDISFSPATAFLAGQLTLELEGTEDVVQGWGTPDDVARWHFRIVQPGFFQAQVTYSATGEAFGRKLELSVDGQQKIMEVQPTSDGDRTDLLTVAVPQTGPHELSLAPAGKMEGEVRVKLIRLTPIGSGKPGTTAPVN